MYDAGIPAPKVLYIATWGPAVYTGNEKAFGNGAVGKAADLVLENGEPTVNISNIRNTALVFAQGLMYNEIFFIVPDKTLFIGLLLQQILTRKRIRSRAGVGSSEMALKV